VDAAVGPWLWALEDSRRRTLEVLAATAEADIDQPGPDGTSMGTLLYHVAAIEASWLYEEIVERPLPPEIEALFPHPVRDATGRLQSVTGEPLGLHLRRLSRVRAALREVVGGLSGDDLQRVRRLPAYDVSPGWVLHHLLQHEAEHRGALAALTGRVD
jgi:uncharacterized damage-inducible protein DinB